MPEPGALQSRPATAGRDRDGCRIAGMRGRVLQPAPRVLEHAGAHRRGQVQPVAVTAVHVEFGQDPERLGVALEPVGQPEPGPRDPIQDPLTQVPERRVTEIVRAGRGLDDNRVAAARARRPARHPDRTGATVAMALATAVTLMVWVSRLCTTWPAAPCEMTWVTAASREKYGENLIRSRSTRNAPSVAATRPRAAGRGISAAPACQRAPLWSIATGHPDRRRLSVVIRRGDSPRRQIRVLVDGLHRGVHDLRHCIRPDRGPGAGVIARMATPAARVRGFMTVTIHQN